MARSIDALGENCPAHDRDDRGRAHIHQTSAVIQMIGEARACSSARRFVM
jgi:hypothetical protein